MGEAFPDRGKKMICYGGAAAGEGAILVSVGGLTNVFRTEPGWPPMETMWRFSLFLHSFVRGDGFELISSLKGPDGVEFCGNVLGVPALELHAAILSPDSGQMLVLEDLIELSIEQTAGDEIVLWWPGGGFLQRADRVSGPWVDISDAASPWTNWLTGAKHDFYRVRQGLHPGTGTITGTWTDTNGHPLPGATVGVRGTDNRSTLGPDGSFTLTNVMAGECFFDVYVEVELHSLQLVGLSIPVQAGQSNVVELTGQTICCPPPPACTNVPWCGIVGGSVDGVRKVVAGGGVHDSGNPLEYPPPLPSQLRRLLLLPQSQGWRTDTGKLSRPRLRALGP